MTGCIVDKKHHFKCNLIRIAITFDIGYEVVTKSDLRNGSCRPQALLFDFMVRFSLLSQVVT